MLVRFGSFADTGAFVTLPASPPKRTFKTSGAQRPLSANSGYKPLHRRLLSSKFALRGSAFSFGPGLPVRIISECDREAQERGQHQPQIEHIDCAHAGIS